MELQHREIFPSKINLRKAISLSEYPVFQKVWKELMDINCHNHEIWQTLFVTCLREKKSKLAFQLAATWSINMVAGSYCFPRYVAALASRSDIDAIRHGLLENAWDESGSHGHTSRSHFWLAVKLAKLLRLSDKQIENIIPIKESIAYTDKHFNQCATGNFEFALGMICLIEEFTTPEFTMILKAFLNSVREELNMSEEDFILNGGAEYFTANIADDERHREEMPALVATLMISKGVDICNYTDVKSSLEEIKNGIKYSADLRQIFFDGIYDFIFKGNTYDMLYLK